MVDKNYSHSTIKKVYDALNEFYGFYAAKEKFDNPMLFVTMLKKDNIKAETKIVEFFEEGDIDKFIEECDARYNTGTLKYRYGYALAANIYLGMRVGELFALQWRDIDFENNTIYICKTLIEINNPEYDFKQPEKIKEKGIKKVKFVVQNSTKRSKNRYIPINSKAKDLLLLHRSNSEFNDLEDYVITTRNRETTTTKNISDTMEAYARVSTPKQKADSEKRDREEIFEEILSLLHGYSMKWCSKRKAKKIREVLESDDRAESGKTYHKTVKYPLYCVRPILFPV